MSNQKTDWSSPSKPGFQTAFWSWFVILVCLFVELAQLELGALTKGRKSFLGCPLGRKVRWVNKRKRKWVNKIFGPTSLSPACTPSAFIFSSFMYRIFTPLSPCLGAESKFLKMIKHTHTFNILNVKMLGGGKWSKYRAGAGLACKIFSSPSLHYFESPLRLVCKIFSTPVFPKLFWVCFWAEMQEAGPGGPLTWSCEALANVLYIFLNFKFNYLFFLLSTPC